MKRTNSVTSAVPSSAPLALLRAVLVFLVYYGAARLGVLLAFPHTNVTPFWPASGIAVAALVLFGHRYWPALFAGELALNLTTGLSPAVSAALGAGDVLEYVIAAELLRRATFSPTLRRLRDAVLVGAIAPAVAAPFAATIGTAALFAGGNIARTDLQTVWSVYLVGDAVGILVFAPFILIWSSWPRRDPRPARLVEAAALALIVTGSACAVFLGGLRFAYLLFPLVVVAASRFGQRGATAAALVVSLVAVAGTTHGLGPFQGTTIEKLLNLQVYLAAFALTALTLAATAAAQRDAERSALEQSVRLEESNRELEAFAYTIAHDLRAPLRAIDGYSKAVLEDYEDDLPPDATRSLDKIGANAIGMGRMIDALLEFSRLGSKRVERTMLRPGTVARQAFERLRAGLGERIVEAVIAETPPCRADPTLLGLVYQNLIGNSLKFVRPDEPVSIDVGWLPASTDPNQPVYYVRDNGIGFDMRYIDKIFGVFQRLHRDSEYPGTGAGLAIVKRIVNRHGGELWAQAEVGRGATFFFTLREGAK